MLVIDLGTPYSTPDDKEYYRSGYTDNVNLAMRLLTEAVESELLIRGQFKPSSQQRFFGIDGRFGKEIKEPTPDQMFSHSILYQYTGNLWRIYEHFEWNSPQDQEMKNAIIIHASQQQFKSADKDFPRSEPYLGVSVRLFHHIGNDRPMVEVYYEAPNVTSPGRGSTEEYDPDALDTNVREKLIHISERCRVQAEELLVHSERLMQIACQDSVLDTPDLSQLTSKPQYPVKPREIQPSESRHTTKAYTPEQFNSKPRTRAPKPEIDWSEE